MYITHNFKNFDQPYTRFPLCKKFAAILQPVTEETKKLLRKTEGPRHDDFSSDRILDPQDRSQAKATISKLAREIREQIKALTKYERISHNSINELNRFFDPSVDTDTEGQAIDDSPNPGEASEIRRKSLEQKKKTYPDPTGSQTGPTSENKGKGEGKGSGRKQGSHSTALEAPKLRSGATREANKKWRTLWFNKADLLGNYRCTIYAQGLQKDEFLRLKHVESTTPATSTTLSQGGFDIMITDQTPSRLKVQVEFQLAYLGPITVKMHKLLANEGGTND
jgi:hypothetical protein